MTITHPILRGAFPPGPPTWWLTRGASFFFAQPLCDAITRHAKRAGQAAQGTAFFVGAQNFFALLFRITIRLRVFPTTALTVVTKIPLLVIFREAVLHELVAPTVDAPDQLSNHDVEGIISLPLEPLPAKPPHSDENVGKSDKAVYGSG